MLPEYENHSMVCACVCVRTYVDTGQINEKLSFFSETIFQRLTVLVCGGVSLFFFRVCWYVSQFLALALSCLLSPIHRIRLSERVCRIVSALQTIHEARVLNLLCMYQDKTSFILRIFGIYIRALCGIRMLRIFVLQSKRHDTTVELADIVKSNGTPWQSTLLSEIGNILRNSEENSTEMAKMQ